MNQPSNLPLRSAAQSQSSGLTRAGRLCAAVGLALLYFGIWPAAAQQETVTVSISADGEGQVQPGGDRGVLPVTWGDTVLFTAQPGPDQHVDIWRLDNAVVQVGGTRVALAHVTNNHGLW